MSAGDQLKEVHKAVMEPMGRLALMIVSKRVSRRILTDVRDALEEALVKLNDVLKDR